MTHPFPPLTSQWVKHTALPIATRAVTWDLVKIRLTQNAEVSLYTSTIADVSAVPNMAIDNIRQIDSPPTTHYVVHRVKANFLHSASSYYYIYILNTPVMTGRLSKPVTAWLVRDVDCELIHTI